MNLAGLKSFFKSLGVDKAYHRLINFNIKCRRIVSGFRYYFYNSFLTFFPSYKLRIFYLRHVIGIKIGHHTSIAMGCFFNGNHVIIGDNSVIARKCYIDGRLGLITIKNNVSISPETYILSMTHIADSPTFESVAKEVIIEDYVWIGARAMILPGVKIETGAILGAASTASKNISMYSIFAGAPAKEIGKRSENLTYFLNYFPYFN